MPIFQDAIGTWHLSRYEDVKLLLTDNRFSRRPPIGAGCIHQEKSQSILENMLGKWVLYNDPPEHTRLREYFSFLLTPQFFKNAKSIIEAVAQNLLNSLLQKKDIDFMPEFASILPSNVLNTLLGTSLSSETIRTWSRAVATAIDHGSPEDLEKATNSVLAMQYYFKEILQQCTEPSTGWISDLLSIQKMYQLSLDDIVAMCIFLLLSGQETVHLSLGLSVMTLLQNPIQLKLLQEKPELIPSAVEEILRYSSPLSKLCRWTTEEININNTCIPAGQLVVGLIYHANNDPIKFTNPHIFDVTRKNNRHLTFGCGIHHCLGALLARFELQISLIKLIPHLHKFSLQEDEISWLPNSSFRYLAKLPIKIS